MKKHRNELVEVRNALQGLWVAAVFALILRAYLVEAFVIPTGSMAPRLMGQHVMLVCPDCGTSFQREYGYTDTGKTVNDRNSECPNCHLRFEVPNGTRVKNGDRVMVIKLPEFMSSYDRWDVIVFKDVISNTRNFIKRLVGLPGEALKIVHGDLYRYPITDVNGDKIIDENDLPSDLAELTGWEIVRKDYEAQQILWQSLFDSEYVPANLPQRVVSAPPGWTETSPVPGQWDMKLNSGRAWHFKSDSPASIRFADGRPDLFRATNAYNTIYFNQYVRGVCNDLRLETVVQPNGSDARVRLILQHYDHLFAAEADLSKSEIVLLHHDLYAGAEVDWDKAEQWGTYKYDFAATSGHPLRLALWQADYTVGVAVDDEPVIVTTPQQYDADIDKLMAWLEAKGQPSPQVSIEGVSGDFTLWRTKVLRDIYYTDAAPLHIREGAKWDYARKAYGFEDRKVYRQTWARYDNPIVLRKYLDGREYLDEFFMCGDNSPSSHDSRRWLAAAPSMRLYDDSGDPLYRLGTVPRYNIIGRAFMVYWPSGYPIISDNKIPLAPDAGKIRRIR